MKGYLDNGNGMGKENGLWERLLLEAYSYYDGDNTLALSYPGRLELWKAEREKKKKIYVVYFLIYVYVCDFILRLIFDLCLIDSN